MTTDLRQKILALRAQSENRLFTLKELVRRLQVDAADRRALARVLRELEQAGLLFRVKRNKYSFGTAARTVTGKLEVHRRGFGFVRPESGGEDIFVGPRAMGAAVHGDKVVVELGAPRKRVTRRPTRGTRRAAAAREPARTRELGHGRVVQVLERASQRILGRVFFDRRQVFLQPLDERQLFQVRLAHGKVEDLREGAVVEADLLVHPGRSGPALGRLRTVLGYPGDADLPLKITLCRHGIRTEFPSEALQEAEAIPEEVGARQIAGRRDFRDWPTVTIDGETARDFDDAVTLESHPDGTFLLGVHIADVSHYVQPGSALDQEAFQRGNSVYFPDRAVPMLPARLSSGICSLKPAVDRLVFSVLMHVSASGDVASYECARGVIRSDERMTYTDVGRILLERDPALRERYRLLVPRFEAMQRLCEILRRKRRGRGAIDLELPEAEIRFGAEGELEDVVQAERNVAHRLIEEFMLLANETVAGHLTRHGGGLYRIHEAPDPDRVREFAETARLFGYTLERSGGVARPVDFQRLADELSGQGEADVLHYLMLRTFMQARYSEANTGHFGLASGDYTHFTSPIRRYADLVVHRLLAACLARVSDPAAEPRSEQETLAELEWLQGVAAQVSQQERIAADAEREMVNHYRAQLMSKRLGEEFEGRITSVIGQGFFVQIQAPFVEGYVPAAFLEDDYYVYQEQLRALVGRHNKRMFRLGDRLRVLVDSVDLDARRILFSPA